ncbi:hypothetical protein BHQ15_16275 [Mycolicibacillus koreensis]|nr:hypothetical protein BHQ15_16275 [Mycolicibacillus koreensis]
MRFNPPPNWPPAPPGWTPEPGWQPDPAWGPPPPGWPLWVPDTATPARRTTTALWIGLGAAVLVVAVAITAVLLTRGSGPATTAGPPGSPTPTSGDPAEEPPITTLSTSLLVDRSAFPDLGPDAEWSSSQPEPSDASGDSSVSVTPSECKDFLNDHSYTSDVHARLGVSQTPEEVLVSLQLGSKKLDVADYVDKCARATATSDDRTMTVAIHPLDLTGLPSWATGYSVDIRAENARNTMDASARVITGYYRAVKVEVESNSLGSGPSSVADDDLVDLFNAQVDKLAAAP